MTVKKYQITSEGLIDANRFSEKRRGDPEERNKCPEAFLFSIEEAKTLYNIRDIIIDVNSKYSDIPKNSFTDEIINKILDEYIAEIERKRISKRALIRMNEKAKNGATWTATAFYKFGAKNKPFTQEFYKISTSNPEQIPDRIISVETCPAYYEAKNQADRARALGINELYQYVSSIELNVLQSLNLIIIKINENKQAQKDAKPGASLATICSGDKFYNIVSSNITNAINSIGTNAKRPIIRKGRNKQGQQIDIAEYMTNAGLKISFDDFNPFTNSGFLTVGDPNTDKLLLQAQLIARETKQQAFEISINDFMSFRGISDNKTANESARAACEMLTRARLEIDASTKNTSIFGGLNFVQECYVISQSGAGGNKIYINFTDKVYKHILELSAKGQQIEQLDRNIVLIPNKQNTAYNIAREFSRNLRINAGGKTSHRLSVKTLLSYCPLLPLYPENKEDAKKDNYLDYPSQAPDRIIKPFIKALTYLTEEDTANKQYKVFESYTFTDKNDKPLSAAKLTAAKHDYKIFINLYVNVVFANEPNYTNLIERKIKRAEQAEKAADKNKPGSN